MKKEIIKGSENLTKKEIYVLTMAQTAKMTEAAGQIVDIDRWAEFKDVDMKTGEERDVLSIMTADGEVFSTISKVFIEHFNDIVDLFGDDPDGLPAVKVIQGKSKNGRQYLDVTVAM